jgi:hypothetical protein
MRNNSAMEGLLNTHLLENDVPKASCMRQHVLFVWPLQSTLALYSGLYGIPFRVMLPADIRDTSVENSTSVSGKFQHLQHRLARSVHDSRLFPSP